MKTSRLFEFEEEAEEDDESLGWDDLDSFNDVMSDFEDK